MESLTPKNHLEEVALFRYALIGELARRSLEHGECAEELRRISTQRVRPPGSDTSRCYAVPTLERWLYACREGGLPALTPRRLRGRGFCHRVMRHFLHRRLGPEPIAVARLPSRLETPSSRLPPVVGSGALERLTPLGAAALTAQLPAIAPRAEAELNPTPLAYGEPVLR